MNLPSDILYELLLLIEVNELPNWCLCCKQILNICNNQYFWRNKFLLDQLPFEFNGQIIDINQCIETYYLTKYLLNKVNEFIINYKKEPNYSDVDTQLINIINYLPINGIDIDYITQIYQYTLEHKQQIKDDGLPLPIIILNYNATQFQLIVDPMETPFTTKYFVIPEPEFRSLLFKLMFNKVKLYCQGEIIHYLSLFF